MPGNGEAEEPGWEVDPDDEWGAAVLTTARAGSGSLAGSTWRGRELEAMGRSEGAFSGRPVSDPRQLRILELCYSKCPHGPRLAVTRTAWTGFVGAAARMS